jgi:hypothetical protein
VLGTREGEDQQRYRDGGQRAQHPGHPAQTGERPTPPGRDELRDQGGRGRHVRADREADEESQRDELPHVIDEQEPQ